MKKKYAIIGVFLLCVIFIILLLLNILIFKGNNPFPKDVQDVTIISSSDGSIQLAKYYETKSKTKEPLIVSLHSWSGNYSQYDSLITDIIENDWNYIHPDFRGANTSFNSCLNEIVIKDIDDSIDFCINLNKVDTNNIFIIGVSGGGMATLGYYLKGKHKLNTSIAWVPISDLQSWYNESVLSDNNYHNDILTCTSINSSYDLNEIRKRSPLYWDIPLKLNGRIELFAGINDSYKGTVSILHSLNFYNKIIDFLKDNENKISMNEIVNLLSRNVSSLPISPIEGRDIYFKKGNKQISITIFGGNHEMLPGFCIEQIKMHIE